MPKNFHSPDRGRKALTYGAAQWIGPLLNARHPKRVEVKKPQEVQKEAKP